MVVGRGVAEGVIELRNRKSGERREVTIANAVAELGHT